jgi:glyoxylase-like metal-dependent hydrolase (beta-lactamase superfamily II)
MSSYRSRVLVSAPVAFLFLVSSAFAQDSSTRDLASAMIDAMGGQAALEAVDTIVFTGTGTRTRIGQMSQVGAQDTTATLEITETLDLANGRAAFVYSVQTGGGFSQQRTEVLTHFEGQPIGWATGGGRPNIATSVDGLFSWAAQNSPEWLLRRNVISIALAAAEAPADQRAEQRQFNGRNTLYGTTVLPLTGEEIGLYFNPDSGLLEGFSALDTEVMLGDVQARYILEDYREVAGLRLPYSITVIKDDAPYSSLTYTSIAINDGSALGIFDVPEDAHDQARAVLAADGSWAPVRLEPVTTNVWHAVAYSHHSMVVEYPDFVAVIEAPYTQAQSLTLARLIMEETGKPVRYVVPTHPHYDHTGGVRAMASLGATVVVAAGHEAEMRRIVESDQTNPPDELARRRAAGDAVGEVEVFEGTITLADRGQRVVLYEVEEFPHMQPMVVAYVPAARVIFQSDLFFGAGSRMRRCC